MNTTTHPQLTESQVAAITAIASNGDRDLVIKTIRSALRARSGKSWSVTGGRGTAYSWITIFVPPARIGPNGASDADRAELGNLLGLGRPVHHQGENIPASSDFRRLWISRAVHGHPGPFTAEAYWD